MNPRASAQPPKTIGKGEGADRVRLRRAPSRGGSSVTTARHRRRLAGARTERWRAALGLAGLGGFGLARFAGISGETSTSQADAIYVRRSAPPSRQAIGTKSDVGAGRCRCCPHCGFCSARGRSSDPAPIWPTTSSAPRSRGAVAAAERAARARGGEGGGGARRPRRQALIAQPAPLRGLDLAHRYGIPVTTVIAMMGHSNPSFTLACYGRDPRDEQTTDR